MGHYSTSGTRYTKGTFPATAYTDPDPVLKVTARVVRKSPFSGEETMEGTEEQLAYNVGDLIRQSELDRIFPAATVDTLTPATGTASGGTVVTIKGRNLDGVTGVTFGGTAGTALTVVDATTVRVTTPAKTAGAYNVVVTDDSGTTTKTNAFTFS